MEQEYILFKQEGNVGVLSINKPKALNALDSNVLRELNEAITSIEQNDEISVVIITGEGKAFVAGADISEMSHLNAEEGRAFGEFGSNVFRKIELLNKPVIAVVNGFALGGGCELAMSCDIRLAGEKAKFGQPEVGLGITPGFDGTQRLSRLVGMGKAKELIFTAGMIGAEEALKIGLVNHVYKQEELMDEALKLANKIASKSQSAVRYSKEAINRGIQCDMDTASSIESQLFGLCFAHEDQKEGMSAFLEKRKPQFAKKLATNN